MGVLLSAQYFGGFLAVTFSPVLACYFLSRRLLCAGANRLGDRQLRASAHSAKGAPGIDGTSDVRNDVRKGRGMGPVP